MYVVQFIGFLVSENLGIFFVSERRKAVAKIRANRPIFSEMWLQHSQEAEKYLELTFIFYISATHKTLRNCPNIAILNNLFGQGGQGGQEQEILKSGGQK